MAKYDPLKRYLSRQKTARVDLTFRDVERIIGAMLLNSAARPQWWANEASAASTHVQAAAWREAGYKAFLEGGERVRFERASASA
jgi:hypothetical protein